MKRILKGLYRLSASAVEILGVLLTGLLFVSGYLFTCYAIDMDSQLVLTRWDNALGNALLLALFLLAAHWVCRWVQIRPVRRNRLLLCLVLAWYVILGFALAIFGRTVPAADAMSTFSAASELALGNTGVIHPTDSYLSYYPQQMGLVACYEIIIRLWRLLPLDIPAYHAIKCINVCLACAYLLFQYGTVRLLFRSERINTLYLMIMFCNFPLIMYTSFVYGEIPSLTFFSAGLWGLLKWIDGLEGRESPQARYAFLSLIAFAVSVAVRKNALILIIAVFLVTFLEGLCKRHRALLGMAVCSMALACCILPAITSYYERRAGNDLSSGVPPLSYVAMGMQESSRADGWYNGFNFNTFQATGMDTEATNEISKEAIAERLSYFGQHPKYALQFYRNKFLSQWCDGTYASRQATLATFGGRIAFFKEVYEGRYSSFYIDFCNGFQNLLYAGAFLFCLAGLRRRNPPSQFSTLPLYLGLIGILGGFLFHMLWEGNSRYIFPYGMLLVPYASYGLNHGLNALSSLKNTHGRIL